MAKKPKPAEMIERTKSLKFNIYKCNECGCEMASEFARDLGVAYCDCSNLYCATCKRMRTLAEAHKETKKMIGAAIVEIAHNDGNGSVTRIWLKKGAKWFSIIGNSIYISECEKPR